ncbi:catechol 2,3-dioxygenase [Paenibacillus naphthalenovorans]|uniref:catechol 2,3-dioxygenase n=1 Tax=Paenibacillus naphthalenovorans TaxID=162209 RepID=UPI0010B305D0|nr:catechol 2,3-dioxygenase [Paenibacillus naphthalenovorans]GCL71141.1 catechol 2,3-dioxygenase [Paenibacillus naphthalenovorans]
MDSYHEPIRDIAHLGHVELLTPKPDESLRFFKDILGMEEAGRAGQSVYLRGWGQYERYCMKLTESKQPGIGHTALRTYSPQALERRYAAIEKSGYGIGWTDGDIGHGKSYRFMDPDGHQMEIYFEAEKYQAPEHFRPALKNQPQKYTGKGVGVRQLDHINYLAQKVEPNSQFMQDALGLRVSEQIVLDNGTHAGSWLYAGQKSYELVYTLDATNRRGRLHHITFCVDSWDDLMRAANIYVENDIVIEGGPAKHAIQQTLFLYCFEPGGNRIELATGGYFIFAPDWETVTWTQAERAKGQAWRTPTIPSFHTYGTPVVEE